ncbi:Chitinase 2, partial [Coemansia nantahalensis]
TYYIAAAPQCPFPDAYLGPTLDSAWFDMVFVQFYNNYCGLNAYPRWFNFEDWDNWAKTKSANKDVKIFIGAPGSPTAASSGYADGAALRTVYDSVRSKYTSLGGVMTWDTVTSLSTFVSSFWTTSTYTSTYTLHRTSCFLLGGVALCDWGLSRIRKPLCEVERIQRYPTKLVTGVHTGDGSEHRAIYTARGLSTRIEYVLLSAVNDRYSALLKLQTLGAPFGNEWVLRLDLPAGQTVDHVDHSRVTTTGTSVTIQPDGTGKHCERMSVLLTVNGTYTGAYRTPDLTNAYFNLA